MKKRFDTINHVRCPSCDTKNYYYRAGTDNYACKQCGQVFVIKGGEGGIQVEYEPKFS